jgi:hypothetical protein
VDRSAREVDRSAREENRSRCEVGTSHHGVSHSGDDRHLKERSVP